MAPGFFAPIGALVIAVISWPSATFADVHSGGATGTSATGVCALERAAPILAAAAAYQDLF